MIIAIKFVKLLLWSFLNNLFYRFVLLGRLKFEVEEQNEMNGLWSILFDYLLLTTDE